MLFCILSSSTNSLHKEWSLEEGFNINLSFVTNPLSFNSAIYLSNLNHCYRFKAWTPVDSQPLMESDVHIKLIRFTWSPSTNI